MNKSYKKMGCGNSKEKLEDEMIKLKFERAQIQMERKNQIKILEGLEKKKITEPVIPDFINLKPERQGKKLLTETKKKPDKSNNKNKKETKEKNSPDNKKRSKSVKTKNKKTESTGPESKKDVKAKITKKTK